MMKKIIFAGIIGSLFFHGNNVFAETYCPEDGGSCYEVNDIKNIDQFEMEKADYDQLREQGMSASEASKMSGYNEASTQNEIQKEQSTTASKEAQAARDAECDASGDCIDKTSFTIDTSLFSVGGNGLKGNSAKETINNALGTIIQKLMIALGVIALLVMSIGAGYMILYHGQDEYLSKGKNIFMGGITALVVALCSYYLVNLVGYILYK